MWIRYLLKNFKLFFKAERNLFLTAALCIAVSGCLLCMISDWYQLTYAQMAAEKRELTSLVFSFSKDMGEPATKGELHKALSMLSDAVTDEIDMILVGAEPEPGLKMDCRFSFHEGRYDTAKIFAHNMILNNETDRYFTEEEERDGKLVAIVPRQYFSDGTELSGTDNLPVLKKEEIAAGNYTLDLQGKTYQVISCWRMFEVPTVPFSTLSDDTPMNAKKGLRISFSKAITPSMFEEVCTALKQVFGEFILLPDLPEVDENEARFYQISFLLFGCMIFVSAADYGMLFTHLLNKQKRILMIYRICGSSKRAVCFLYFAEGMLLLLPALFLGMVFYCVVLFPRFTALLPAFGRTAGLADRCFMYWADIIGTALILYLFVQHAVHRETVYDAAAEEV